MSIGQDQQAVCARGRGEVRAVCGNDDALGAQSFPVRAPPGRVVLVLACKWGHIQPMRGGRSGYVLEAILPSSSNRAERCVIPVRILIPGAARTTFFPNSFVSRPLSRSSTTTSWSLTGIDLELENACADRRGSWLSAFNNRTDRLNDRRPARDARARSETERIGVSAGFVQGVRRRDDEVRWR